MWQDEIIRLIKYVEETSGNACHIMVIRILPLSSAIQ